MEYKVSIGAEVRTGDIDKQLNKYDGKINVGVNPESVTGSIDTALKGYRATPIEVGATLVTQGITDKIKSLNKEANRKNIKVNIDPVFDGLDGDNGIIAGKTFKTGLKVPVKLNWSGVAAQIANPDFGSGGVPKLKVDVDINDEAIATAMSSYLDPKNFKAKRIPIYLKPQILSSDWTDLEETLKNYEAKNPVRANITLKASAVNKAINEYNKELAGDDGKRIIFNAVIRPNAIDDAIKSYVEQYPDKLNIPINFKLSSDLDKNAEFDDALKQKLEAYDNHPFEVPVRLRPAKNGFKDKISKISVDVDATLANADGINNALEAYSNDPIPISAKLVPATKGFASEITKTPIQIEAELSPTAINNAITNPPKGLGKLPIGITLKPENVDDINNQVKQLAPLVAEALEVNVKLNEQNVNNAISGFTPTATLDVKPELALSDIDDQIRTYVPKEQVKVNVFLDDNGVDPKTGKQIERKPIEVNVKLNRQSINDEIKDFKTNAKIKVGVKLDFASHKNEEGKEIQKGVAKQIKDYNGKTKIRVGIQLDDSDIATQIGQINTSTPVLLGVQLDPTGVQNIRTEIDNLRQELTNLSAININVGNNRGGAGNGGSGGGDGGRGGGRRRRNNNAEEARETAQAYQELLRVINELGSKRAKLNSPSVLRDSANEINELESQIADLEARYDEIMDSFEDRFTRRQQARIAEAEEKAGRTESLSGSRADDKEAIDERSSAYTRLMRVLRELGTLRKELSALNTLENPDLADTLTSQIQTLEQQYNNMMDSIRQRQIQFTADQQSQMRTLIDSTNRKVERNQSEMNDDAVSKNRNQAYDRMLSTLEQIHSVEQNIAKLRSQGGNNNQIAELENHLSSLMTTYQGLIDIMDGHLTTEQWASLDNKISEAEQSMALLQSRLVDVQNKAARKIQLKFNDGDFNVLPRLNSEMQKLSGAYPELEAGVREVESALREMQDAIGAGDEVADVQNLISAHERFEHVLKNVNNQLSIAKRLERDSASDQKLTDDRLVFQAQIDAWLRKNSAAADRFGAQMLQLKEQVRDCDRQTLNHLQSEFKQLDMEAEAAGLKTQSVTDRIKSQFMKYSAYFSVAEVIMYATQAVKDMFEQVKLIDSAMTELKKVTNETDESYNRFLSNAASRAKELGTTIDGLVSSTADFARLGYSFEESQGLAEVANVYAVVGDEIEGVEDATQSLVSTLAAFRHEIGDMSNDEFALSIVDKMNEVANNYAISSGGLGQALQRSASSMAAANNTLDETIALITAANEVAQNPEKVGNAFKTMSMRIRGAKTELEEAGESTDGMAESTASLREEMLALSGVDIMLNENTFKSTYQIMDELSHKWEDLSDIAQATIIELVAGKHQGNVFSSLMANFDTARAALDTSLTSSGSAMAEHAKWSESLEARLNKLKAAWQSLSQTFMNSDFLKGAIDFLIKFVDTIDNIIDKVGALPVIIGGFTALESIFGKNKILSVFQMLNTDLDGFTNRVGIANKSLSQLMATFKHGNGGGFKGFFDGLMSVRDSIKGVPLSKSDLSSIQKYNDLINQNVGSQTAWYRTMQNASSKAKELVAATHGGTVSMKNLTVATNTSKLAMIGMSVAATAMNAALTMGISALITWGISKLSEWIVTADELSKKVDDVTDKYKEQHKALTDIKGDYDTSNEDSIISKYAKLSKGVDGLGRNISLTTDEYAEYLDISNTIAEQVPSLVAGYDAQGNAIINYTGNIKDLIAAYENLIKIQNDSVLTGDNAKDIDKDFKNAMMDANDSGWNGSKSTIKSTKALKAMLDGSFSEDEITTYLNNLISQGNHGIRWQIAKALKEEGLEGDVHWYSSNEPIDEFIADAIKNHPDVARKVVGNFYNNLEKEAEGEKAKAAAALSNAFDISDSAYADMSDGMRSLAYKIVDGFDAIKYDSIINSGKTVEEYVNNMLDSFKKLEENGDSAKLEAAFNLQTQFNGGDIPYGEYIKGIQDAGKLVDGISGLDNDVKNQIKLALNTKEATENYEALKERLSSDKYNIRIEPSEAEAFLNDLTASEYAVAVDLIANDKIDLSNINIESLRRHIEEQAKIQDALNFNASISVDTAALETFNTALSESASAVGLTSESISALESKYKKLDGYDQAKLFEATTNGVKVNREEVAKLEKEYDNLKKTEVQKHLDTLVGEYNRLTKEIDKTSNASERSELIAERSGYLSKIEELAQYQAQLEGVTGAYQRWIDAQNTSEDYEGYEAVAKGWKTIKDEISRGLLGNASKEYIDLLSGKDLQGADFDSYVEAWKKLDDKVTSTGYSVKDFFTLNSDGEITSTGINRFFESIKKEFSGEVYKLNEETGKYYYDFSSKNLETIQREWGIGIDAIGLLLEAAVAAGYNVDWDGILDGLDLDTSNFDILIKSAEAAQKAFNELSNVEDVNFNFKTSNIKDATSELEKAQTIYQELITDDNGNINFSAPGAQEMYVMLTTLLVQKQQLEDSNIAINVDVSGLDESQQYIANAIEWVKNFREKYKNLEIAITTGKDIDVAKSELNTALGELQNLGDDGVDIAAKLVLGEGADGEALKGEVNAALEIVGKDNNIPIGFKLSETGLGSLNSKLLTNFTKEATVTWLNNTSDVDGYKSEKKEAEGKVKWSNDDSLVVEFQNTKHEANGTVYWDDNTVNLQTTYTGKGIIYWNTAEANGTANVNGTTSGCSFARGNWGIKGSGTALGGELGMETLVRDGRFYTIGDNGAEFFKYKQGDIIFNHKQTEELFKNGKVTSGGGRGRMFANGSAFADGSYPSSGRAFAWASTSTSSKSSTYSKVGATISPSSLITMLHNTVVDAVEKGTTLPRTKNAKYPESKVDEPTTPSTTISDRGGSGGHGGGGSSSKDKEEFEETVDWIETAIDRIERAIDKLDKKTNNVYKSWSDRNSALTDQIAKVGDEINLQQQAYDRYLKQANSVGLSETYASKVRNGTIDIETIKDEELKKKIDDYKNWYDKALACQDAIEDLRISESELYAQRFEYIQAQYDGILQGYEHTEAMLNEYISQAEEQGHIVSKKYYQALIDNEKDNIDELRKEQADLIAERDKAVADGKIVEGSEAWFEQCAAIDEVTQSIEESTTSLLEYDNAMRDIDWQIFDLIQERISGVAEEADFLIELMSNKKLFDDDGKLTSQGIATMALHAQSYNTNMYQADEYGAEVAKLNAQIAEDPYDQNLINRRNELIELQREAILNAEQEKESIKDLVEEGISLELDALQERIDKYNESIDAAKDLYDYQKNVQKQSEEIASLEKQRAAYLGNDSEEAKAKLQEIEVSLKDAREGLQETEYERYISGQQELLDTLYGEYELILNQRIDNIDYLLEQVIESINTVAGSDGDIVSALGSEGAIAIAVSNNAESVKETLTSETNKVGITLSNAMNSIWSTGDGNAKSVLTMYGEDFKTKSTTIVTTLNSIKTGVNNMVSSLNKEAASKTTANKTSTSAKKDPTKPDATSKSTTTTKKSSGGDGTPKVGDKVKFVSGQYYYDSQGTKPLGSNNQGKEVYITNINTKSWATHPYHISTGSKLGSGDLGWLKLNQISGYATGKYNFTKDEDAWTQENGKREFIVRPSDGAILTPIARRDSVLTSAASKNIWDMANSPTEFIKNNLGIGAASVPNNSTVQNSYTQYLDKVVFNLPNVHNYEEFLSAMKKDRNFERLVQSMTIDQIAGKSSLGKGKSIR